jgi:hypothetical protein
MKNEKWKMVLGGLTLEVQHGKTRAQRRGFAPITQTSVGRRIQNRERSDRVA